MGETISACMIIKNEAANLPACLAGVKLLADQIVVVDTGSTDGSAEIAQQLGAEVHHFPWIDDFSAARNESLRYANGDWVFWLDADDRLSPATVAELRRAVASGQADAYGCIIVSRLASGLRETTEHIRLFRNGRGICFVSPIHETVLPIVLQLGLRAALTDIEIEHVGYRHKDEVRKKGARNLPIVEAALAADPENLDLLYYRGQARENVGDLAGAESDLWAFLERTRATNRTDMKRIWAYATLCELVDKRGDLPALEVVARDALEDFPGQPYFTTVRARILMTHDQAQEALRCLNAVAERPHNPDDAMWPPEGWLAMTRAECFWRLGDLPAATGEARMAWQFQPDLMAAPALLARLLVEGGCEADAEEVLQQVLPTTPTPEPWLALYDLRLSQNRPAEAAAALAGAQRCGLSPARTAQLAERCPNAARSPAQGAEPVAGAFPAGRQTNAPPARAAQPGAAARQAGLAQLARGELVAAAEQFAAAIEAAPGDAENYRCLAVTLEKLGCHAEALETWQMAEARRARPAAVAAG